MLDIALSLAVLGAIALVAGGFFALRRGQKQKGVLMFVLAAVMAANVVIWTAPGPGGEAPLEKSGRGPG